MTMDEAIVNAINERLNDAELNDIVPPIGSLQNDVNQVVSEYRQRARETMFGIFEKDNQTGLVNVLMRDRNGGDVLYPKAALEMANNQQKLNLYGR
jgi:hypothetical protein